jgi:predicted ATPase
MRRVVEWSHDLLDEAEKAAYVWLSVFSGGFTPEATEAVLPTQPHTTGVLDLVLPLLDKNLLLAADESRFGMLETIRDYGRRKT